MNLKLGMTTSKLVKTIIFIVLLIAASGYFGNICHQIGQLGDTIFAPSMDTLYLFLWLLLALALVTIAAGLVATLVRPLWMCFVAFALSSLAMLFIWGISLISIVLAVIYLLAGLLYSQRVNEGLNEYINFSGTRPIEDNQTILLVVLIIAACASFYSGYAAQIEREGFTMPPIDMVTGMAAEQIAPFVTDIATGVVAGQIEGIADLPPGEKERAIAEFGEQLEQQVEGWIKLFQQQLEQQVEAWITPYQQWMPIGIAIILLIFLMSNIRFFLWVPILVLRGIFAILAASHVTKMVTKTQEVRRLTID
ncbi:hypothetical protein M1N87_01460 [Dehalococcoidia bacterium]|nr:hypothetical protein [Dehalococcoidia bacterium]MCL0088476.1 hypothetical protein [Dehalococcoidia bacterium]